MQYEESRQYLADTRYDSYASFFDHEWAQSMSRASENTPLSPATWNLCEGWKSAANTARLPWLTVHMYGTFVTSFMNAAPSRSLVTVAMSKMQKHIIPALSDSQMATFYSAAAELDSDMAPRLPVNGTAMNYQKIWSDMLKESEFSLGVIGSQRLAFAAIYYSYEDFVINCYKLAFGITKHRIGRRFADELTACYSASIAKEIWTCDDVHLARLIRHAIAHNGCRETRQLKEHSNPVGVIDGVLQVTPSLMRLTYKALSQRAVILLRETLTKLGLAVKET